MTASRYAPATAAPLSTQQIALTQALAAHVFLAIQMERLSNAAEQARVVSNSPSAGSGFTAAA